MASGGSRIPPPISFPDGTPLGEPTEERTVIATVPFELLEQSRKANLAGPEATIVSPLPHDHAPKASPPPVSPLPVLNALDAFDAVDIDIAAGDDDPFALDVEIDLGLARPTPSRSFGVEATGEFRLDQLVGREGGTLVIGDPTDIVETSVVRAMSGDGLAVVETRICIGRDVEALLRAGTVLSANPGRPRVELSAFEAHVLDLLDGHRTVDEVARAAGVSLGDLRIALALLADKSQLAAPARAPSGKHGPKPAPKPTPKPAQSTGSSPWDVPPAPTGVTLPETPSRAFRHALVPRKTDNEVTSTTSALERFVLSRVDGRRTVAELLTHVALDESDLALALDLLEQRGLITLEMAPTPAPAPAAPPRIPTPPPTGLSVEGLLRMATRLEDADDVERAIPLLKRASEAAPDDASIWNRLGVALARAKDLPGARVAMARALGLNPDDPIVLSNHRRIANLAARAAEVARG